MGGEDRLRALHDHTLALLRAAEPTAIARETARAARAAERADAAAVLLLEDRSLRVAAHDGLSDRYALAQVVPLAAAQAMHSDHDGHAVVDLGAQDIAGEGGAEAAPSADQEEGVARMLSVPLVRDGELIGALNVYTRDPARLFDADDVEVARIVAAAAATAMTRARLAERAAAAEHLREQLIDSLGEAVVVAWRDGRLAGMNPAARALFGLREAPETLQELGAQILVRDERSGQPVTEMISLLSSALTGGVDAAGCYLIRNAETGGEHVIETIASPVRSTDGAVVGAVMAVHDVTPVREAERRREEFVSVVSHELKTPLTPLKAIAQLLRNRLRRSRENGTPPDLDSLERNLATIERQVDRMNGLVNDLLEVSRAGRGTFRLHKAPFDLATTVREMAQRYAEATAEEGRHSFTAMVPEALPFFGDQGRIEQVLWNLIGNAVKYSPRGGAVRVDLTEVEGEAVISVADDGIGVRREDLEEVGRSPFSRGGGKAGTFAGMGIGLYLSRLVAQGHGGEIEVDSPGEDGGTTVRVRLPIEEG